ncbi:hypothetical protein [Dyadobacter helix]|uniref:hypothetical protein n=1 Tax=Dyadobacter helix TaxID=2822344 RepID=UPI001E358C43|nr:hypothetical protein [Dyadobacter sp. CECT 9275]
MNDEQKLFARRLVEHSLLHHHIFNIWDKSGVDLSRTRMFRFTGTLGEVVFADCYHLPRPTLSFGAQDGQDLGQDFRITSPGHTFSLDIKSMKRRPGTLSGKYVLNIPASQLQKKNSRTTHYFCISFHQGIEGTIASLLGFVDKEALINGNTGRLYRAGTPRLRHDNTSFTFLEDTYEVLFSDMAPPIVTEYIRGLKGFKECYFKD